MSQSRSLETASHKFGEVVRGKTAPTDSLSIENLKDVRMNLTANLGHAFLLVREVLELKQGSVVPLDKLAGETTDVFVNDIQLAKGEVVVIADSIHVRIAEISGITSDRDGEDD